MSSLVYQHHPNGTTYVYENVSVWDKEKKVTRNNRTYVGRILPGSTEIVPPYKKSKTADSNDDFAKDGLCQSLVIGPTLLLDKAVRDTGLGRVLDSVFPDDAKRILTCAYYLASEGKALSNVQQWSEGHVQPWGGKLANQRVSELLERITPSKQLEFFQKWAEVNSKTGYFAMDITSISSYSELIDYVRRGYNRDHENLPQVNFLMLTCEETRVPIYFSVLNGSIHDVSTLQESLKCLSFLQVKNLHLVMDKGFFSGDNVDALYHHHFKFALGVPFTSDIAKNAVKRNRDRIADHTNYMKIGRDVLFAVTEKAPWDGHHCYIHTYYDEKKAVQDDLDFMERLTECYTELCTHKEQKENQRFYQKFFTVKDMPKRGRKVMYNEDAIASHRKNTCGWFVMISNDEKDAKKAMQIYRDKDTIEKEFDDLKNELDMERLRSNNNDTMHGRFFVQFVALILITHLKCVLEDAGLTSKYDSREALSEMKSISRVSIDGTKKKYHTTLSKDHLELLDAFGIKL